MRLYLAIALTATGVGAFLNFITGLAAIADMTRTGLSRGAPWFATDIIILCTGIAGAGGCLTLIYRELVRAKIKAGFARPIPTPETRDLENQM